MRRNLKHIFLPILQVVLLIAVSCATGGGSVGSASLDEAIQSAVQNIENSVQTGQKIAAFNFASPTEAFSAYVLEELATGLVSGKKLVVVDRRELDIIRQEENFQMSGEVSDESQMAIGKKLGAQLVVSGSLTSIGDTYRFRIKVLNVETALPLDLGAKEPRVAYLPLKVK